MKSCELSPEFRCLKRWMIDRLVYTLVKGLGWVLCRLPPGVAVWLGERLGVLWYWLKPKRRRVGVLNLRAAFDGHLMPAQVRRIIRDSFKQLGAGIPELLRLPVMDQAYINRHVTIEGLSYLEQAVASKRPVVMLTGHVGNWELGPMIVALKGYPISVVAREQTRLSRLYQLLVSYRESKGCKIIHTGGAFQQLMTALDDSRLVGIVGDSTDDHGLWIDFFGRPALAATGAFELALRKQAVLIPAFIRRSRGPFHRVVVEPPMEPPQDLENREGVRQGLQRFTAILERIIREEPAQWMWMHKRWKRTPTRRVLILSDGTLEHLKQSRAIVEALQQHRSGISSHIVEIRYRHRFARLWCLFWSWWRPVRWGGTACLQSVLTPDSARALLSRYADLIISCGSSLAPVNHLWAWENRAKTIVIMNPAPLPEELAQICEAANALLL